MSDQNKNQPVLSALGVEELLAAQRHNLEGTLFDTVLPRKLEVPFAGSILCYRLSTTVVPTASGDRAVISDFEMSVRSRWETEPGCPPEVVILPYKGGIAVYRKKGGPCHE